MLKFILRLCNKSVNLFFSFLNTFHFNSIKVLMMHEIIDNDATLNDFMQLHFDDFKTLLEKLKNKVISINQFYTQYNNNEFNNKYVITFDDVHESVYEKAYPLLKQNNLFFTLFVNLSLLDTKGYITTDQLIEMSTSSLCTIASHGVNHFFHRKLNNNERLDELNSSKEQLEKIINKPVDFFAFPYGSLVAVSFDSIKQLKNTDYLMSFSTIPSGVWKSFMINKWFIPRINVTKKTIDKI